MSKENQAELVAAAERYAHQWVREYGKFDMDTTLRDLIHGVKDDDFVDWVYVSLKHDKLDTDYTKDVIALMFDDIVKAWGCDERLD